MPKVTYIPGEGDPHTTRVHGVLFRANVPVEIAGDKKVEQLISVARDTEHGERRTSKLSNMPLVKLLATNPQFSVEGEAQAKHLKPSRRIESAEDYQAYALEWINQQQDIQAMDDRWDKEQPLRDELTIDDAMMNRLSDALVLRAAKLRYLAKKQAAGSPVKGNNQRVA
jgi:hypothetical protein